MPKRLFISKNASEIEPYRAQLEAKGYSIIAHSFLSFSPVPFRIEHNFDVIFFGSPRAVIFFKAQQSLSPHVQIACVGSKTAEVLESMGHTVDFVGEKSSDPKSVAREFSAWLGNKRVLFPVSDRSLKTISSVIDAAQKEEVVVYSTEVKGKVIPECDVYVFSSPSNVEGFFTLNSLPSASEVFAWGKSTEGVLKSLIGNKKSTLTKSSIDGLIDFFK